MVQRENTQKQMNYHDLCGNSGESHQTWSGIDIKEAWLQENPRG